jgi:carbon monoxide dehydrogenase subunit G
MAIVAAGLRPNWHLIGDGMWETTVVVERSQLVDAQQDRVFSLLADPVVWSLRPGHFAFEVAAPPGSGRLFCWLGAHRDYVGSSVLTVREEVAGQMISFRTSAPGVPQGELVFTLSAMSEGARVKVTITVRQTVRRGLKPDAEANWPWRLQVWLDAIRAAVEGRRPWPGTGIPPDMSQRLAGRRKLKNPVTTAVAGLIAAPPEQVWEAFYAPDTLSIALPEEVLCGGHVPGTPERQVGEMQYQITRNADGKLWPSVSVVTDLVPGHSALVQSTGPLRGELYHLLTPVEEGTRVEMVLRLRARSLKRSRREDVMHSLATQLQTNLNAYKAVIEESPDQE